MYDAINNLFTLIKTEFQIPLQKAIGQWGGLVHLKERINDIFNYLFNTTGTVLTEEIVSTIASLFLLYAAVKIGIKLFSLFFASLNDIITNTRYNNMEANGEWRSTWRRKKKK